MIVWSKPNLVNKPLIQINSQVTFFIARYSDFVLDRDTTLLLTFSLQDFLKEKRKSL